MKIKDKIIKLLGGYTFEEINYFRRRKAELEAIAEKQKEQMAVQFFDAFEAKQANKTCKIEFADLRERFDKLEAENASLIQRLNALESGHQPSEAATEQEMTAINTAISCNLEAHQHDCAESQTTGE